MNPFIKVGKALYPANDETLEWFDKFEQNSILVVSKGKNTKRRSDNHRRFFAFLATAFDMQDYYQLNEKERFRADLLTMAGHCEYWRDYKGNFCTSAKSISFESLPEEEEFRVLFKKCVDAFIGMYEKTNGVILSYDEFMQIMSKIEAFR